MSLENKVHSWKILQGFLKKLKDLTKKLSVLEATCFSYPPQNHPKNKPGGYPLSKRGYWIPNNMSFV